MNASHRSLTLVFVIIAIILTCVLELRVFGINCGHAVWQWLKWFWLPVVSALSSYLCHLNGVVRVYLIAMPESDSVDLTITKVLLVCYSVRVFVY